MEDRINKGFLQENVWLFCRETKKSGFNNEVTIRWGSTVPQDATF